MPRRPLAATVATLSALTALTACNPSPEAGRPNTTPTTPTTTPTPTAPSTPTWTPEEETAITAAIARYTAARVAAGVALNDPSNASHNTLEAAGNGGAWLQSILARIVFLRDRSLYQTGAAKIVSTTPAAVNLKLEQPAVALTTCIDGAGVVMRYRANGKPVPVVSTPGETTRHSVSARLVFAPAKSGTKMWFLIEEKTAGPLLRRLSQGFVALVLTLALGSAWPDKSAAIDIPPGYKLDCDPVSKICTLVLIANIPTTGSPGDNGKPGSKKRRPACQFKGAAQACTSALGNWSNSQQCYMRREHPQPPFSDPRWKGHTDGSIWACVRQQGYDEGEHLVTEWVWLPGEADVVVVDPVTLAYRAIASMQLAPPLVKTAPGVGQVGLVNMPVWLWVTKTENTWGPIERSASVPGLSVTATAQVKAINWTMGDGSTVRCAGAGTPYDKSMGIKDSPDCGHRYKKTSRELPKCNYPVTATAQWDITWQSTLGDTGQISMTQQAATQLRIAEAVPVLVDPNDSAPAAPAKSTC